MTTRSDRLTLSALALAVSGALAMNAAVAQDMRHDSRDRGAMYNTSNATQDDTRDAREQVDEATQVVHQMKRDPQLTRLLARSKGVLIIPDYGKGAAVVGAQGGEGVLLLRNATGWSSPAFYNMGGVSVGAQGGAAAGSIAVLLMTDKAVDQFKSTANMWSLNANAGLTVVNYSADAQASAGKGDIVFWSDTEGLFAGASIGVSDIVRDEKDNRAYYNRSVTEDQILASVVKNPDAKTLQEALPTQVASR